jgi:Uma2 family endonuclease
MSATVTDNFVLDNFTAIEFLANGRGIYDKVVLLSGVSWRQYEQFLNDFEEKAGWHLAYDNGNLEIMPPLAEHETPSRTIELIVYVYSTSFDLTLESLGSTTFRRKLKKKGIDPDACFYIQSADKIIGKSYELKPESYPVPDVAVEIDVTHGSLDKFAIYAALGVAELWIYDGSAARFYQLSEGVYHQIEASLTLSLLTAAALTEFLALSKTDGQTAALKRFREWLKTRKSIDSQ